MRWAWIEVGCAECSDWPLTIPHGVYDSEDEAKAAAGWGPHWREHPFGGWADQTGSGADWIVPLEALERRPSQPEIESVQGYHF